MKSFLERGRYAQHAVTISLAQPEPARIRELRDRRFRMLLQIERVTDQIAREITRLNRHARK